MDVAVGNLPLPDDCINIINSYVLLDEVQYKNKLIWKSVNYLMRRAASNYNCEVYYNGNHIFRWYYTHVQYQSRYCVCGDYIVSTNGPLNDCCMCKCYID